MRAFGLAALATLALGLTAAPQIAAAAPDGSYRDSCRDWRTDGSILTATCRGGWGWRQSSIDYTRCGGDIANLDGRLVCRGRNDGWDGRGGDWRDRDNDWRDRDNDWRDNDRGGWRDNDRGDWNGNGGWNGGGWGGGARITLYGQTGFGGRPFTAGRDVYNLDGTGFNDRAESVRIDGGVWQLCEDRNFGGRCVTLSRSTPDLFRFGVGDRVSSIRRLR